ncbi:hypothetical protein RCL1_001466 [Eukaryota sp. TZLM3-RCL]
MSSTLNVIEEKLTQLYKLRDFGTSSSASSRRLQLSQLKEELFSLLSTLSEDSSTPKALLWYLRGRCIAGTDNDYEEAESYLSKAIKLDPGLLEAYFYLADVYTQQQHWLQAKQVLEAGIERNRSAQQLSLLSRVIRHVPASTEVPLNSLLDQSVALSKEALDLDLTRGDSWLSYALSLTTRFFRHSTPVLSDLNKAMLAFNKAQKFEDQQSNPDLYYNRAQISKYLLNYSGALSDYSKCQSIDPSFSQAGDEHSRLLSFVRNTASLNGRIKSLNRKKVEKMTSSILSSFSSEFVTLKTLKKGIPLALRVFSVISDPSSLPCIVTCYDSTGEPVNVAFYDVDAGAFKGQPVLSIVNPVINIVNVPVKDRVITFPVISVINSDGVLINGASFSSEHRTNVEVVVEKK